MFRTSTERHACCDSCDRKTTVTVFIAEDVDGLHTPAYCCECIPASTADVIETVIEFGVDPTSYVGGCCDGCGIHCYESILWNVMDLPIQLCRKCHGKVLARIEFELDQEAE